VGLSGALEDGSQIVAKLFHTMGCGVGLRSLATLHTFVNVIEKNRLKRELVLEEGLANQVDLAVRLPL